jgi:chromatin segregation and condensation protein Rec8/ScpA/Scc1 (kleisin family)
MTTTSVLMTHGRYFNNHDLQVLRDYALEAPWEWRMLFEQLADAAEDAEDVEDAEELQAKVEAYEAQLKSAKERLDEIHAELDGLIPVDGDEEAKKTPWIVKTGTDNLDVRARLLALQERLSDLAVELGKEP